MERKKHTQLIFVKPTKEDVIKECEERKNGIDGEYFWNFYEAKDWMIGKNKMKNWKSAIRTWEIKNKQNNSQNLKKVEIKTYVTKNDLLTLR